MTTVTVLCRWCNNPFQIKSYQPYLCCSAACTRQVRRENGRLRHPRDTQKEQEIINLYRSGKTLMEIGQQYHMSHQRVSQILKRAECETRGPGRRAHRCNVPA